MPNRPMATGTKPIPSASCGKPNVMRGTPELTSMPTSPRNTPTMIIRIALMADPCASTTALIRPKTIRLTVSTAVNFKAK